MKETLENLQLACQHVFVVAEGWMSDCGNLSPDRPDRCSGLQVVRYGPGSLRDEFGDGFDLMDSTRETHHTPFGREQKFIYCYCRKY